MADKILLIREAKSQTADGLAAAIEALGAQTIQASANIEEIRREAETADALLVVVGDFIFSAPEIPQLLKDLSLKGGRPLFAFGYRDELDAFETIVTKTLVEREFLRPANAEQLARELCSLVAASAQQKSKKHILLVDDDVVFLQMMQKWITPEYRVSIVKSGAQALGFVKARMPDLLLLDYDMPDMSGPQVLEKLREEYPSADLPVFFLTGKCDEKSAESAARLEPSGYLLKAAGKEHVLDAVRHFFTEHP